jgi:hypothetical protein
MQAASSPSAFVAHRSSRALFLPHGAQHVETWRRARDLVRAAAMLLGILSWGTVFLLLAG